MNKCISIYSQKINKTFERMNIIDKKLALKNTMPFCILKKLVILLLLFHLKTIGIKWHLF